LLSAPAAQGKIWSELRLQTAQWDRLAPKHSSVEIHHLVKWLAWCYCKRRGRGPGLTPAWEKKRVIGLYFEQRHRDADFLKKSSPLSSHTVLNHQNKKNVLSLQGGGTH